MRLKSGFASTAIVLLGLLTSSCGSDASETVTSADQGVDETPVVGDQVTTTTTLLETSGDSPLTFDDYEISPVDELVLTVTLNACWPTVSNIDVTESPDQVIITLTEAASPPPTTNELGEADIENECQSATNVDLQEPLNEREVIDGNTGRAAEAH